MNKVIDIIRIIFSFNNIKSKYLFIKYPIQKNGYMYLSSASLKLSGSNKTIINETKKAIISFLKILMLIYAIRKQRNIERKNQYFVKK